MVTLPGMTEMVFRALSTLKVLKAETFPRSTNSVTYLKHDERIHEESVIIWDNNAFYATLKGFY